MLQSRPQQGGQGGEGGQGGQGGRKRKGGVTGETTGGGTAALQNHPIKHQAQAGHAVQPGHTGQPGQPGRPQRQPNTPAPPLAPLVTTGPGGLDLVSPLSQGVQGTMSDLDMSILNAAMDSAMHAASQTMPETMPETMDIETRNTTLSQQQAAAFSSSSSSNSFKASNGVNGIHGAPLVCTPLPEKSLSSRSSEFARFRVLRQDFEHGTLGEEKRRER